MSISPVKFVSHEMKTTLVKVYSYDNKQFCGVLINPFFNKEMVFENAIQFLLLTDELLDSLFFPLKAMEFRQFSKAESKVLPFETPNASIFNGKTPLATFELNVIFRQNASWQGNVLWLEKNTSASFRSFMELIILMDSVLIEETAKIPASFK